MNTSLRDARLHSSVRRYTWYVVLAGAYFWMPLFVLYFSSVVSLRQVFVLESIYYGAVFLMEVPSGYFSDVVGRKRTLLLSALFFAIAYALFFIGGTFTILAAGQVFLAMGFAFASGTDTSLHFALLSATGREDQYGPREARLASLGLIVSAIAALAGGAFAWLAEYRAAYVLSFAFAAALFVLFSIADPDAKAASSRQPKDAAMPTESISPLAQGRRVFMALKDGNLRYLFVFMVLVTVINHIPYEFYQLYVRGVMGRMLSGEAMASMTPLVTGVHVALTMVVSSWFARLAIKFRDSVGTKVLLLAAVALQTTLIALLAVEGRAVVVLLLLLRSVPAAVSKPVMRAAVAPAIPSTLRATYLSFQSLAGRLAFSIVLFTFSILPGDEYHSAVILGAVIGIFTLVLLTTMRYRRSQ